MTDLEAAIDEGFTMIVAAQLLTGQLGNPGMYAGNIQLDQAAQAAVRLRTSVREATGPVTASLISDQEAGE